MTPSTPEGPAATRQHWADCAVNHGGAECDMGPECGLDLPPREIDLLRARLVEVERELAAARAYGATMDLGHDMAAARALQAESRASAAEGALRAVQRKLCEAHCMRHGVLATSHIAECEEAREVLRASAALSGLPPLVPERACDCGLMVETHATISARPREHKPGCASLKTWAQPTPAALVPKEEAK